MRIAILDAKTLGEVPNLYKLNEFGTVDVFATTNQKEVIGRVQDYEILITNKVKMDKTIIDHASKLKLICKAATGLNDVDVEYAKSLGIAVKNVKDYSTHSVSQLTFTLILYLLNKPSYYDHYVKSGEYSYNDIFTHLGRPFYQLFGKSIGIIGFGAIGQQVAHIAEGFGMEVFYYSTSGKNKQQKYKNLELDELLSRCDIVSIHAPLNEKTHHLIDYEKIVRMKKTSLLINTGRGGIINEEDLSRALNEDLIWGAGLDVFSNEPIEMDNPLLKIKNKEKLILTPHIAWSGIEARTLLVDKIVENIREFLTCK